MVEKKVLFTAPEGATPETHPTIGGMVDLVSRYSECKVVFDGSENYDFSRGKVKTNTYQDGHYYENSFEKPSADLWIFYSDGHNSVDPKSLGYSRPSDYHSDLMDFLEKQELNGNVGKIVNSPECERKTLKNYFSKIDPENFNVIPTYDIDKFDDLYGLFVERNPLVAKPNWGGGMHGVSLIDSYGKLDSFKNKDLSDIVFQDYVHTDIEKRMYIVNGEFVEGRVVKGRENPWTKKEDNNVISRYNSETARKGVLGFNFDDFSKDLKYTQKMVDETGLSIGSIDFMGDKINEVNGAGTGFTFSDLLDKEEIDVRPFLFSYLRDILK